MSNYNKQRATKLHIVEGLPAVGKSTFSYKLYSEFESSGLQTVYFKEEKCQPVDLFRQAVLTKADYHNIIRMNLTDEFVKSIEDNTYYLGDYAIVAYTQLNYNQQLKKTLLPIMIKSDIGDGRADFEKYKKLHILLWEKFVEKNEKKYNYIAEGALIHNQLLDIIGFYELSDDIIVSYFRTLIDIISPLKPHLYYIFPSNIEALINSSLLERGCEEGSWGYGFFRWLKHSMYGKKLQLNGKKGLTSVYQKMHKLSLQILDDSRLSVDMIERKMG